jgi:hypothetical protein
MAAEDVSPYRGDGVEDVVINTAKVKPFFSSLYLYNSAYEIV